jgi:hypothetical protein
MVTMRNVADRICRENQNTIFAHIFPENPTVYELVWENMVEPDRLQMAIQYGPCALHAG